MDAEAVEAFSGTFGQLHVLLAAVRVHRKRDLEVHAGDDFGVRQLPNVDMMAADNSRKGLDVLADILDTDVLRGCLKEDPGGGNRERNGRLENDSSDDQGYGRVGVIFAGPLREPDD